MNFAKQFECSGLSFTPVCIEDAASLFQAVSSSDFPSELPLAKLTTYQQAQDWCLSRELEWDMGHGFVWSCHRLVDSSMIGQVTLLPQKERLVLAYWIDPAVWGQGLAVHMCRCLLSHLCDCQYQGVVSASVHHWNNRSRSVLVKLGFVEVHSDQSTSEYQFKIV